MFSCCIFIVKHFTHQTSSAIFGQILSLRGGCVVYLKIFMSWKLTKIIKKTKNWILAGITRGLVGNVVNMLPTWCNVGQMSKNFEIDTNVHDTEKFFHSESCVCGMLWSPIVSDCGLADKKIYLRRKYFLTHKRYQISRVFICQVKIVRKKYIELIFN